MNRFFHYKDRGGTIGKEITAGLGMFFLSVCGLFINMQLIAKLSISGEYAAATRSFNIYYQNVLTEYEHDILYGKKIYLKKGESVVYRNARTGKTDTIRADRDGYVITYNANRAHLTYIEKLAKELGILLSTP